MSLPRLCHYAIPLSASTLLPVWFGHRSICNSNILEFCFLLPHFIHHSFPLSQDCVYCVLLYCKVGSLLAVPSGGPPLQQHLIWPFLHPAVELGGRGFYCSWEQCNKV